MAFVLVVIFSNIESISIQKVLSETSANTGVAPAKITAFAVAAKVILGTITSSPGPISRA